MRLDLCPQSALIYFLLFQFLNISGSIAAFAYSASHSDVDYFKALGLGHSIYIRLVSS